MQFWLLIVFFLFFLIQFWQWLTHFALPFPLAVFGGALLAIASNYEQGITSFLRLKNSPVQQTATLVEEEKILEGKSKSL